MSFLRRAFWGSVFLALIVVFLGASAYQIYDAFAPQADSESRGWGRQTPSEPVFTVSVTKALPQDFAPIVRAYGRIEAGQAAELRAPQSSVVTQVLVDIGETVEQGQTLLQLDDSDALIALERAKIDLDAGKAERDDAMRAIALAEQELEAASAQVQLRAANFARQQDLTGRGIGSAAVRDEAELALEASKQAVLARQQALNAATSRYERAVIEQKRHALNLRSAQNELEKHQIKAPFSGVIEDLSVGLGAQVGVNAQLVSLVSLEQLRFTAWLSSAQHQRLARSDMKQREAFVQNTVTGDKIAAQITGVNARIPEGGAGRLLQMSVQNSPDLRVGDFMQVHIYEEPLQNVVVLPATALAANMTVLALTSEGRLETLPVSLLRRQEDLVVVQSDDILGRDIVNVRTPRLGAGVAAQARSVERSEG